GISMGYSDVEAHVCWGAGGTYSQPTLNARCSSRNKLEELDTLQKAGLRIVPFFVPLNPYSVNSLPFPVLARRLRHHGGFDIRYCKNAMRALNALRKGRSYFTKYIPSTTEFRVWVYRKRHLGTYEKVLAHPEMKRRMIGRNYKNGYAFQLVNEANIPRSAVELATLAVDALGLDFGAV